LFTGRIDRQEPFGKRHFEALPVEVNVAQPRFGEGNLQLFCLVRGAACGLDQQQRDIGGVAVYADDGPDISGAGRADVDNVAADEVVDVDGVLVERSALVSGDGYVEVAEGFRVGDGVDSGKFQDDAAFVEPVAFELNRALGFSVRREQGKMPPLSEPLRKIGEDVGDNFAVASLGADEVRDEHPWLAFCHWGDCTGYDLSGFQGEKM
jgi:hypothetical protein